jgi:hypothetical protein
MSTRKKSRTPARRSLLLESLETRQMLAGNVTALLSGGNLLITGDSSANDIQIDAVAGFPGRIRITPQANVAGDTTLNGQSLALTYPSFGDIRINLGGGSDDLEFLGVPAVVTDTLPGNLVIDGGLGNNNITVSDYNIGGSLVVRSATGTDTVTIDGVVAGVDINVSSDASPGLQQTRVEGSSAGRDLIFANRAGDNQIDVGEIAPVTVGRNLSVYNSGSVANNSTINLNEVTIDANLLINNLSTATITIGSESGPTNVAHHTSIRNGNGDNTITVQNESVLGTSAIDRVAIWNASGNDTVTFNESTSNAQVDIRNVNGDATVTTRTDAIFNSDLRIVNGVNGDHDVSVQSASVGALYVFNGNGASNNVNIGTTTEVSVAGKTSIFNGSATGDNVIAINNATLGGLATLSNGNAGGTNNVVVGAITANAVATSNGLAIYNGNGDSDVALDNLDVAGSLSVTNGAATTSHSLAVGVDGLVTVGGNANFYTYNGDSTVTLDQLSVGGDMALRTGAGDDVVVIAGAGALGVTIVGKTSINLGANTGTESLTIGNDTGTATFVGYLTVLMGTGADTIVLGPNTASGPGTALGDGNFLFDGGVDLLGTNSITIDSTVIDPFVDLATFSKFRNLVIIVV